MINLEELLKRPDKEDLWASFDDNTKAVLSQEIIRLKNAKLFPDPMSLAKKLDPLFVQTKALDLINIELVEINKGLQTMMEKRQVYAEFKRLKYTEQQINKKLSTSFPQTYNDRLIISMPPQEGKTTMISKFGILWFLRNHPTLRIGVVSYDADNATRISYSIRAEIERADISIGLKLVSSQKALSRWNLQEGGGLYATGIGGGLTGRPIDLLLIDDPVKDYRNADSMLLSSQAWQWWQTVARPRLAPYAPVILVMTRWHEADLAGRMIDKQEQDSTNGDDHFDKWKVINIPAEAEQQPDILGRKPGQFMQSARGRTRVQWLATKRAIEPRFWSALYQGKPTPDVGDIWLKTWWRRYDSLLWSVALDGSYRLKGFDTVIQSWDAAFRNTKNSDFVCGQVWAKKDADAYLIYQVWARLSFSDTVNAIRRVSQLFPDAKRKIIEAKANGDAIIDSLKHEIPGIIPANPTSSKEARASAVSPFIRAGNVYLPTAQIARSEPALSFDIDAFIQEATSFPNGAHDDQVDATSQALSELYLGPGGQGSFSVPSNSRINSRLSPMQQRMLQRQFNR